MIETHVLDQREEDDQYDRALRWARRIAEEGIVLLKNEGGVLPLDEKKIRTLAVIGANAVIKQAHGGESSAIKAFLWKFRRWRGL